MCTSELVAEILLMVRKKNKHFWKQFVSSEYNSVQDFSRIMLFNYLFLSLIFQFIISAKRKGEKLFLS